MLTNVVLRRREISTGDVLTYEFYQSFASTEWVITHDLDFYPDVRAYVPTEDGSDYEEIQPSQIIYDDMNTVRLIFSEAQSGYARVI